MLIGREVMRMKIKNEDKIMIEEEENKIKYFTLGIVVGFLMVLISIFMGNNNILMALGVMLMGTVVIIFPFCTPDTVKLLGYKESKILGRILGIITIAVGIWIWIS